MRYVYILYSYKDKKLYTGFTKNINKRIEKHLEGNVKSTPNRLPLELIYFEAYKDKRDTTKGREFLKRILKYSLPKITAH